MSSIPNSAMPHARDRSEASPSRRQQMSAMLSNGRRWARDSYKGASRSVRSHPRITASAVAATVLAGLAATFAPRLLGSRRLFAR